MPPANDLPPVEPGTDGPPPGQPPETRGRKPVLDPVKQATLCALVAAGLSQRQAAQHLDCSPSAVTKLARRDPDFARRLRAAVAQSETSALRQLLMAGKRSWRASAWFLERRFPERYGPATQIAYRKRKRKKRGQDR